MSKTSTIVQFRSMVENLRSSKKNLSVARNLVDFAKDSKNTVPISDPDYLRILGAMNDSIYFFVNENKIKESTFITDNYIDLLEELNNPEEMIRRTEELSKIFFDKKDSAYHIYIEDTLNRVVSFLDDDELLEELGNFLLDIAKNLQKIQIHEMAINYFERGMSYLIDANQNDRVLKEIQIILESARVLSLKNNAFSAQYMDLVNTLVNEAGIDISKDETTQLAYQSFSEHLLKSSKTVIESHTTQSGRLHKKKREFFKKKQIGGE